MVELNELQTTEDLEQLWDKSTEKPVLLFKHSTTCPISAGAFKEYNSFLDAAEDNLNGYMVKVIENKEVSNEIADQTNIKHESPQIFLIRNKEVLWNTSHQKITVDSIKDALKQV